MGKLKYTIIITQHRADLRGWPNMKAAPLKHEVGGGGDYGPVRLQWQVEDRQI